MLACCGLFSGSYSESSADTQPSLGLPECWRVALYSPVVRVRARLTHQPYIPTHQPLCVHCVRGGPFDTQGGGLCFFFLSKLFFLFPRPNNSLFPLWIRTRYFPPSSMKQTFFSPILNSHAGTETEQRDNHI